MKTIWALISGCLFATLVTSGCTPAAAPSAGDVATILAASPTPDSVALTAEAVIRAALTLTPTATLTPTPTPKPSVTPPPVVPPPRPVLPPAIDLALLAREWPAGRITIAGTSAPGAPITLLLEGMVAATSEADADGEWEAEIRVQNAGAYRLEARQGSMLSEPVRLVIAAPTPPSPPTIPPTVAPPVPPTVAPPPTIAPAPSYTEETLIAAGSFWMGCAPGDDQCSDDESPLHQVALDRYSIDRFEVTNDRYRACVLAGACTPPHDLTSYTHATYYANPEFGAFPVVNVDWFQARDFCAWEGKRLPTEAEWEKAARGDADTRLYPWGDAPAACRLLNFNTTGDPKRGWEESGMCVGDTAAVDAYPAAASPYGVLNLSGNVWEWVSDWYGEDAYARFPARNPQGPSLGVERSLRGGSWGYGARLARVSFRDYYDPQEWGSGVGFRCARSR